MAPYEEAPHHVVDARYLGDYLVWLQFRDGRKGIVDRWRCPDAGHDSMPDHVAHLTAIPRE